MIEHGSGALPKQDLEKLGTIEVKFTRGTEGNALGQWEGSGRRQNQLVEPISEKAKKGAALLGSVTRSVKLNERLVHRSWLKVHQQAWRRLTCGKTHVVCGVHPAP